MRQANRCAAATGSQRFPAPLGCHLPAKASNQSAHPRPDQPPRGVGKSSKYPRHSRPKSHRPRASPPPWPPIAAERHQRQAAAALRPRPKWRDHRAALHSSHADEAAGQRRFAKAPQNFRSPAPQAQGSDPPPQAIDRRAAGRAAPQHGAHPLLDPRPRPRLRKSQWTG